MARSGAKFPLVPSILDIGNTIVYLCIAAFTISLIISMLLLAIFLVVTLFRSLRKGIQIVRSRFASASPTQAESEALDLDELARNMDVDTLTEHFSNFIKKQTSISDDDDTFARNC
jgi:hypothetical protein